MYSVFSICTVYFGITVWVLGLSMYIGTLLMPWYDYIHKYISLCVYLRHQHDLSLLLQMVSFSSSHEEIYSEEIPLPINANVNVKVSSVRLILNIGFIDRAIVCDARNVCTSISVVLL